MAFAIKKLILFYMFLIVHLSYSDIDYDDEYEKEDILEKEVGSMQQFSEDYFFMGIDENTYEEKGEFPIRKEYTRNFRIDRYPVTNIDFANFVREKRYYTTQCDRNKYSYVFMNHLKKSGHSADELMIYEDKFMPNEPWLVPVVGARWDKPYGIYQNLNEVTLHPVVHVSLADAHAYCKHLDKRLPTEYEWEMAVRGSKKHSWQYPWGYGLRRNRMNVFQGLFPIHDHGYDGYTGLAPVNAFPAQNDLNLYDMLGNVWEWTSTNYLGTDLPTGQSRNQWYTLKGGSFIDTIDGSYGTLPVRNSIKVGRFYMFTAENVGFRCAQTVSDEELKVVDTSKLKPRLIYYNETYEYKQKVKKLSEKFIKLKKKLFINTEKSSTTERSSKKDEGPHRHYFNVRDEL